MNSLGPECSKCKAVSSPIWEKESDELYCHDCFALTFPRSSETKSILVKSCENSSKSSIVNSESKDEEETGKIPKDEENDSNEKDNQIKCFDKKDVKRKTRKGRQGGKGNIPKGKGRRFIFKKNATKAPVSISTPVTSDYLFYEGTYYQVGDIVSIIDIDGGTFYAQIRGLLQDQYCEKSAVITWLLPTKNSPSPSEGFDPATYIIGPEEDVPRKLEYMRFVCHAPSDYFKDRTSPYATACFKPQSCFILSKLGPVIKPIC